jgi:RNase P/RNase MRP subunit p29
MTKEIEPLHSNNIIVYADVDHAVLGISGLVVGENMLKKVNVIIKKLIIEKRYKNITFNSIKN